MKVSPKLLLIALSLIALLAACGKQTSVTAPMVLPDSYLFADDFIRPSPSWARFDTESGAVYALAGELYLEDRGQGTAVYSPLVGHAYADVQIDVSLRHVQGTVNNWMGVICRQQDERNYYLLAISADGYYLVLKVVDGEQIPLAGPRYSETIHLGRAENQLRARCQGPGLYLWVNGNRVAAEVDSSFQEAGNVGLFGDAVPRGETTVIAFANFVLTAP
jgi:hypothetical protein